MAILDIDDVNEVGFVYRVPPATLTSPASVSVEVKDPLGVITTYTQADSEVTIGATLSSNLADELGLTAAENAAGTGIVQVKYTVTMAGVWRTKCTSTDPAVPGAEETATVVREEFGLIPLVTVDDVVTELVSDMEGPRRGVRALLSTAIDSDDTSVVFDEWTANQIRPGDTVEIDYELLYMLAQTQPDTFTVLRAQDGSTADSHIANTLVRIQPLWWKHRIMNELLAEFLSLPDDIYRVSTYTASFAARERCATIPTTNVNRGIRVLDARYVTQNTDSERIAAELVLDEDANMYSTGQAVCLRNQVFRSTTDLYVTVAQGFDNFAASWEAALPLDGVTTGLLEAIKFGVKWRMQATRELQASRVAAQGQARRVDEVPVGTQASVAQEYKRIRDDLLAEERRRLAGRWPDILHKAL